MGGEGWVATCFYLVPGCGLLTHLLSIFTCPGGHFPRWRTGLTLGKFWFGLSFSIHSLGPALRLFLHLTLPPVWRVTCINYEKYRHRMSLKIDLLNLPLIWQSREEISTFELFIVSTPRLRVFSPAQFLQVLWQYLRVLHLQVNTYFKYWLNSCKCYPNYNLAKALFHNYIYLFKLSA